MALKDYLTMTGLTVEAEVAAAKAAIKTATAAITDAATRLDALGTAAETAQADEDNLANQQVLEATIQTFGGLGRDLWAMQTVLRRMSMEGMQQAKDTAARLSADTAVKPVSADPLPLPLAG